MTRMLNEAERLLVEAVNAGREFSMPAGLNDPIRAELIRALLLGEPLQAEGDLGIRAGCAPARGVRVRAALITGRLDLQNAWGCAGSACCAALELVDCRFEQAGASLRPTDRPLPAVDLRHARIARVTLARCTVDLVALDGAVVHGELDLSGLRGAAPNALCWLSARQCTVEGRVRLDTACLCVEPNMEADPSALGDYACDLRGARVGGSLVALGGFRVKGGMALPKHVGADVWLQGARIGRFNRKPSYALKGLGTRIDGSMALRPDMSGDRLLPMHIRGPVDFFDLQVGGSLDLSGAILGSDEPEAIAHLNAPYLRVGGSLMLRDWSHPARGGLRRRARIAGQVDLRYARVTGLTILGAKRIGRGAASGVVNRLLSSSSFESGVQLINSTGTTELNATEIGGDLSIGAHPDDRPTINGPDMRVHGNIYLAGEFEQLHLAGSAIDGQVMAEKDARYAAKALYAFESRIQGAAELIVRERLNVRGAEFLGKAVLDSQAKAPEGAVLLGAATACKREMRVTGVWGQIELTNSVVGGDLDLSGCSVTQGNLDRLRVEGDLAAPKHLFGSLSIAGGRVAGSLRICQTRMHVRKRASGNTAPQIDLSDSVVEGDIRVQQLERKPESGMLEEVLGLPAWAAEGESVHFRAAALRCYQEGMLLEVHRDIKTPLGGNGAAGARQVEVTAYLFVGNRPPLQLNGDSNVFHDLNADTVRPCLRLRDEADVVEYVKLFCGYVWAEEGAFRVLDDTRETDWLKFAESPTAELAGQSLSVRREADRWHVDAPLAFGTALFRAQITVTPTGQIEMIGDQPLAGLRPNGVLYSKPTRTFPLVEAQEPFHVFRGAQPWQELDATQSAPWVKRIESAFAQTEKRAVADPGPVAQIKLLGCSCTTLDDNHGREWKDGVHADLRGFVYRDLGEEQEFTPTAELNRALQPASPLQLTHGVALGQDRLRWLERVMRHAQFSLQPYEVLSDALRRRGDVEAAEEVLVQKLKEETRRRAPLFRAVYRIGLEWPFRYGLSSARASAVALLYWLIGTWAFDIANYGQWRLLPVGAAGSEASIAAVRLFDHPVLVIDSQPVNVLMAAAAGGYRPVALKAEPGMEPVDETRCGDQVESMLYALDVMLPLVDLHQEEKCSISSADSPAAFAWRTFKATYAIIGAYVSSMLILTVSGVLRRKVDR